jgi:pimeloyl-ACP methyl ester carboxylesterase
METKYLKSPDGEMITYYVFGNRKKYLLIFNAPGMSIKFWLPLISNLVNEYTIISAEYRGFSSYNIELEDKEDLYQLIVDDFKMIVMAESLQQVHCAGWCLGTRIMLQYYAQCPTKVLSLHALNIDFKRNDEHFADPFSKLIFQIKGRIEEDPSSISRMIKLMTSVGTVPDMSFLSSVNIADERPPALDVYDILDKESSLSGLAFYLIDNETGLKNYVKIYKAVSIKDETNVIHNLQVPLTIYVGGLDNIITLTPEDLLLFKSNHHIEIISLSEGSHFMLMEFPVKLSKLMNERITNRMVASAVAV